MSVVRMRRALNLKRAGFFRDLPLRFSKRVPLVRRGSPLVTLEFVSASSARREWRG